MSLIPFPTPLPGRDKRWLLMHCRQAAQAHGSDQILFHDAPPAAATLATIEYVHLWAPPLDPVQELPALITRQPSLTHLSIGHGNTAVQGSAAREAGGTADGNVGPNWVAGIEGSVFLASRFCGRRLVAWNRVPVAAHAGAPQCSAGAIHRM